VGFSVQRMRAREYGNEGCAFLSPRRGATPGDIGTLKEKRHELFLVGF